jgi:hypothetical protein
MWGPLVAHDRANPVHVVRGSPQLLPHIDVGCECNHYVSTVLYSTSRACPLSPRSLSQRQFKFIVTQAMPVHNGGKFTPEARACPRDANGTSLTIPMQ